MIVRVATVEVPPPERAAIIAEARRALAELSRNTGLVDLRVGLTRAGRRLVAASVWRPEAVASLELDPAADPFVGPAAALGATGHVEHYELADEEPVVRREEGPASVMRLLSGRVVPNAEPALHAVLRERQAELRERDGLVATFVGRRVVRGTSEVVALAAWRDWAALRAYAGLDLERPFARSLESFLEGGRMETLEALAAQPDALETAPAGRVAISLADAVVLFADDERRYVGAAGNVAAVLGESTGDLLGRRLEDLAAEPLRSTAAAVWSAFLAEGRLDIDSELVRGDGTMVPVHVQARAHVPRRGVHASLVSRLDRPRDPLLSTLAFEEIVVLALETDFD